MDSICRDFISAEKLSQCPDFPFPEFPLLGRSNVGKSSFINALANNKKIAKTSNTPGKTRLINFFNFSDTFMVADLPGYGYAKVSKEDYLAQKESIISSALNDACTVTNPRKMTYAGVEEILSNIAKNLYQLTF